ncbi:MAG: ABC transporter permease [Nitriliruptoraceae bacterium]
MIRIVAMRELRERALKKGYLIGTAITVAIVVAAIALPTLLGSDGDAHHRIGLVEGHATPIEAELNAHLPPNHDAEFTTFADDASARSAVIEGTVDAALIPSSTLLTDGPASLALRTTIDRLLQQSTLTGALTEAGLTTAQIQEALSAPSPLEVIDLSGDEDDNPFMIAVFATILLVVGVQMSGATLLSGALEEKSSRVVEILVSTARPWQLLAGKVIATSLLSMVQLTLIVAAVLATNRVVDAFPLPEATGAVLAVSTVMLLAGFMFYAALFTVAGTLASSMEDAQSTAGPLYFAMWGAYAAVFFTVLPNPSGIIAQILTFLPPTAPFIVPARVALGEIAAWQVPASIAVTIIGALFTLRIAGRIYAASLLAGGRLTWKGAWKAEPIR